MKRFRRKKNGTVKHMMSKKNNILKAIPNMDKDELYSFNEFLNDLARACVSEMRNKNR